MHPRSTIVAIVLFILIVVGMFVYALLKKNELDVEEQQIVEQPEETETGPYAAIELITAKHFYIDGTHTLAGEIPFPTPCDLLEWDVRVAESYPEQVTVDFSVINTADMCAQVITNQRFITSFEASAEADIRARLEGRDIELNLVPAAPGEVPEDFELYIKG